MGAARGDPTGAGAAVEEALGELRRGKGVAVLDGHDEDSNGCLVLAAEYTDSDALNVLDEESRGLLYLCLPEERCQQLGLQPLAEAVEGQRWETKLMAPISHRDSPDVSVAAQAETIRTVIDSSTSADDLVQPGGVLVLRAAPGGVLQLPGQAEAAVDLARLAGLKPAAILCSLVRPDGSLGRRGDLTQYAARGRLRIVTIPDLVEYRLRTERLVERRASVRLPTKYGDFRLIAFADKLTAQNHIALTKGEIAGAPDVPVRIQVECLLGDVFRSHACQCGEALVRALRHIDEQGLGVLVYLMRPHDSGFARSVVACALSAPDSAELDSSGPASLDRADAIASQILVDLGVLQVRLLSDPSVAPRIDAFGVAVVEQIPLIQ